MTTYDGTVGKFAETNSTNWTPFNYSTEAAFQQKADLSMAGVLQDCGECHVGGGAMEYVPSSVAAMGARTSLRDITTGNVNGTGTIDNTEFTTFNYLIDTYDVDGDSDKAEVLYNDYAKTGVGEMDCMMCHLEGYSWDDRTAQIRLLKHDTARAVGAGMATPNALDKDNWAANVAPDGWGTTVGAYDPDKVVDNGGVLQLAASFAANIKKLPPNANCASCHFGNGFGVGDHLAVDGTEARRMVDFKKRGDHWTPNFNWDVHSPSLDCMDCHENKGFASYDVNGVQTGVDATTGTSGAAYATGADTVHNTTGAAGADGLVDATGVPVEMTGAGPGLQGLCDPKKGHSNFESAWNAKDAGSNLTCALCHKPGGNSQYPLAKDPAAAHAAAGLTQTKVQSKNNTSGVADASHIDIIECNTCHIRKLDNYSGAAVVDATGKDHAGRLADHENEYLEKNMNDNLINIWYKGKLSKASNSLTMFWTDKNDQRDANNDGRAFGLDPLLMTHVEQVNSANSWTSLSEDTHGHITPADIDARQAAFTAALDGKLGTTGNAIIPKLSIMGVPFNVDHGTSRKGEAWGAGGCKDCHSPTSNFFSGAYSVKPDHMTMSWNSGDVIPYTKVNSGKDMTSYHPAMVNKKEQRTLPINLASSTSLTTVERSKFMYEETFRKPNTAWSADGGVITGASFTLPSATYNPTTGVAGTTKGLFMHVQVKDAGADDATAKRITMQCGIEVITINGLLAAMDNGTRAAGNLASGGYGFTATVGSGGDTATGNLVLTASAGKVIRVVPGTQQADDGAILGFDAALYVADPITPTLGGAPITGRAGWVNYLNTIASPGVAVISTPAIEPPGTNPAVKNVALTFAADTTNHNPANIYKWDMGDGSVCVGTGLGATYNCTAPDDGNPDTPEAWTVVAPVDTASIDYVYRSAGLFTASLYVTAPAGGEYTSDSVKVDVSPSAPPPSWEAVVNQATTPDQLELDNLPATWTRIYVIWDDGTKQNYITGPGSASVDIPHTYRKIASRFNGTNYVYNTSISLYNGATLLETKKVTVTIAP